MTTSLDILAYEAGLDTTDRTICEALRHEIEQSLPEATSKVWHGHPVWFLENNPVAGYAKRKEGVQLLFWSGQSFGLAGLTATGSFQAAEKKYSDVSEIDTNELGLWLAVSRDIQWDYANIVKKKGRLERLK